MVTRAPSFQGCLTKGCGRTEDYLRTEYLTSFPHLAGAVFGFDGDDSDHAVLRQETLRHEDWTGALAPSGLMLVSAACQPAFAPPQMSGASSKRPSADS